MIFLEKMYFRTPLLTVLALVNHYAVTLADEQSQIPFSESDSSDSTAAHRVAIIGAGAAGSSAAYHLSRFAKSSQFEVPINITLFEATDRIGGRTTTVNALNDPRYPTELGASIFVKVNQILWNATRDFGLDYKEKSYKRIDSAYDLGVWDGTSFVFTLANVDDDNNLQGRWRGWWDIAKLLWKYGLSPIRTQRLAKTAVGRFLKFYDEHFPFTDLTTAVEMVDLGEFTGLTGEELLAASGISEQFGREIIQSSTRVNYAQNLGSIHGLETMVCMSTDGATAVEGGNWQIFDQMVRKSGARLKLNTSVTGVETAKSGKSRIIVLEDQSDEAEQEEYDTVILATPFQHSDVKFKPSLIVEPEKIDYVNLYVTLFTSPYRPSPAFFGVESQEQVPNSILTTLPEGTNLGMKRGKKAVGPTSFWSLSTLRILSPSTDGYVGAQYSEGHIDSEVASLDQQYLYKIFSPEPVSAMWLAAMYGWNASYTDLDGMSALPKELVTWHYEKKWHSYPYLPPRTEFGSFRLWQNHGKDITTSDRPSEIWYTSPIESFISTMETSALSGMNVARMIVDELEPGVERKPYPDIQS